MGDSLLREHWLAALTVTTGAVDAATVAHAVAPDVVRAERQRLTAERAWVETVDWRAVQRTLEASPSSVAIEGI